MTNGSLVFPILHCSACNHRCVFFHETRCVRRRYGGIFPQGIPADAFTCIWNDFSPHPLDYGLFNFCYHNHRTSMRLCHGKKQAPDNSSDSGGCSFPDKQPHPHLCMDHDTWRQRNPQPDSCGLFQPVAEDYRRNCRIRSP